MAVARPADGIRVVHLLGPALGESEASGLNWADVDGQRESTPFIRRENDLTSVKSAASETVQAWP